MKKKSDGMTFVEVIIAVAIVAVAILGTMAFRYYCNINARVSDVQMTAARIGLLLLEDWKAAVGSTTYSPIGRFPADPNLVITTGGSGASTPTGFTALNNNYQVRSNRVVFNSTLSYQDDTANSPPLVPRKLNVHITWRPDWQAGAAVSGFESFSMTTYAY